MISRTQASDNIFRGRKQVHEEMQQPEKVQKVRWLPQEDEGEVSGSRGSVSLVGVTAAWHFQHQERAGSVVGSHSSLFAACQCLIILTSEIARVD